MTLQDRLRRAARRFYAQETPTARLANAWELAELALEAAKAIEAREKQPAAAD